MATIASLQVERFPTVERLYTKILYVILLDTLSVAAAPALANRNRERFLNLIRSCAAWPEASRVSAPQLKLSLEVRKLNAGVLYEYAASTVIKWPEGRILYGSECDPTEEDLQPHIISQTESKVVSDSRYDSLLYVYRNSLLHEFREPGYGMDFRDDIQPYYHSVMNQPWQLVFSAEFLRHLCFGAIWAVNDLLLRERRNPYDDYPFGSWWRPSKA